MLLALGLGALAGCGDDDIELPPLQPEYEAGVFLPDLPEGAVACMEDAECDDGIECTRDGCDALLHYCEHGTDSAMCSDGVFCNGPELCDPDRGCVPSLPLRCDDGDLCTVDSCDEQQKRCVNDPRDFDGDGEVDWHCQGGTDCDDGNVCNGTESCDSSHL